MESVRWGLRFQVLETFRCTSSRNAGDRPGASLDDECRACDVGWDERRGVVPDLGTSDSEGGYESIEGWRYVHIARSYIVVSW